MRSVIQKSRGVCCGLDIAFVSNILEFLMSLCVGFSVIFRGAKPLEVQKMKSCQFYVAQKFHDCTMKLYYDCTSASFSYVLCGQIVEMLFAITLVAVRIITVFYARVSSKHEISGNIISFFDVDVNCFGCFEDAKHDEKKQFMMTLLFFCRNFRFQLLLK